MEMMGPLDGGKTNENNKDKSHGASHIKKNISERIFVF